MKYLHLLWANLGRKKLRTSLTLASIVVAFLLFGILRTMQAALTGGVELAGVDRLITMNKVTFIQPLPESYLTRVRGVDGVKVATPYSWFGGVYQDDRNQVFSFAVDPETFLEVYPEYELTDEERKAWIGDRAGAIVGQATAEKYGWNVGDTIPLRSSIYSNQDGTQIWEMNIRAIFSAQSDSSSLFFHNEYLDEGRTFGRDTIGMIVLRVDDPDRSLEIANRIDSMFANSAFETKTDNESAFMQAWANQMGNIGALVTAVATAVFFTLLLVIANTMGQSVRERTNELAVLKTIGFARGSVTGLVLAESMLLTILGAAIGLALANVIAVGLSNVPALVQYFPTLALPPSTFVVGAVLAIVLGALASALPATQAWQLKIVDALRRT
ncbi:MAG: ABC transporter permease [Xanthomonadaceae bacterium]|nr:ABC transporter permease [Xanthomonadaceae bacterium]